MAAPAFSPVPARPSASAGATTVSIVPGGTVLRITTQCWRGAGSAVRSAATMSATTRRIYDRSVAPPAVDGVPTQIREMSASPTASA